MLEQSDDHSFEGIPELLCTKCGHDLQNPLYMISTHPLLPVPLCILCHEEIQEKYEQYQDTLKDRDTAEKNEGNDEDEKTSEEENNLCHWCFEDDSESLLFLCDHPKGCPYQFCSRCIEDNLGEIMLQEIEQKEKWCCFVCSPEQINSFQSALTKGKELSAMEDLKISELNTPNNPFSAEETDEMLEKAADALITLVQEIDQSLKRLDREEMASKENDIRHELIDQNPSESISMLARNEMELYVTSWTRHIDILQREEAILFETLENAGINPLHLSIYKVDVDKLEQEQSFTEKVAIIEAEKQISARKEAEMMMSDNCSNSSEVIVSGDVSRERRKKQSKSFAYEERVIEKENPNYPDLLVLAEGNSLIQSFSDKAEVDVSLYPSSFEKVVPRSVLKALYYATASEIKEIASTFNIPAHIPIVMSLAEKEFPMNIDRWSFSREVHPAVCKALYHTISPIDSAIICERYNLDPDIGQVTDFGSTKDVYSLFVKEKARKKEKTIRITEKEVNEALQTEEKIFTDYIHQLDSEQSSNNPNSKGTNRLNSSNSPRARSNRKIQSFLRVQEKGDDEDRMKVQNESKEDVGEMMTKKRSYKPRQQQRERGGGGIRDYFSKSFDFEQPSAIDNDNNDNNYHHMEEVISTETREAHRATSPNSPKSPVSPVSPPVSQKQKAEFLDLISPIKASQSEPLSQSVDMFLSQSPFIAMDVEEQDHDHDDTFSKQLALREKEKETEDNIESAIKKEIDIAKIIHNKAADELQNSETPERKQFLSAKTVQSSSASTSKSPQLIELVYDDNDEMIEIVHPRNPIPNHKGKTSSDKPTSPAKESTDNPPSITPAAGTTVNKESNERVSDPANESLYFEEESPLRRTPSRARIIDHIIDLSRDDSNDDNDNDSPDHYKQQQQQKPQAQNKLKKTSSLSRKSVLDEIEFDSDGELIIREENILKPVILTKNNSSNSNSKVIKKDKGVVLWKAPESNSKKKTINDFFSKETIEATRVEKERRQQLLAFDYFVDDDKAVAINNLRPEGEVAVNVSSNFTQQLKSHQIDGLRFLWKNVMGSIADASKITKEPNRFHKVYHGCILAHCMGLGKTFTVISFVVTMLTNPIIRNIEDPKDRKLKLKAAMKEKQDAEKEKEKDSNNNINADNKMIVSENSDQAQQLTKQSETTPTTPLTQPATTTAQATATGIAITALAGTTAAVKEPTLTEEQESSSSQLLQGIEIKRLIYRILIIVPKNTLQNWIDEFNKWTPSDLLEQFTLTLIDSAANVKNAKQIRMKKIARWFEEGGVLIIGYEMFRLMAGDDGAATSSSHYSAEEKKEFQRLLLNPGADLVIADEAHTIKNAKSKLRQVLESIDTTRRIALTGSPLQNNLEEYWVMVNWVKRLYLYHMDEYRRIFVNPIKAGSSKDATLSQVMQMKKRTHALYHKLTPIVHRRDNSELSHAILPKREFILSIQMTGFQKFLYKYYLSKLPSNGKTLFKAYQCLLRIWNHPATSIYHYYDTMMKNEAAERKANNNKDNKDDEESDDYDQFYKNKGKNQPKKTNLSFDSSYSTPFKTINSSNKLSINDFRANLKESFAYYRYCVSSESSSKMMMEIESAAEKLEEKMYVEKGGQNIELLKAADAQMRENHTSMEIDYQEPEVDEDQVTLDSGDDDKSVVMIVNEDDSFELPVKRPNRKQTSQKKNKKDRNDAEDDLRDTDEDDDDNDNDDDDDNISRNYNSDSSDDDGDSGSDLGGFVVYSDEESDDDEESSESDWKDQEDSSDYSDDDNMKGDEDDNDLIDLVSDDEDLNSKKKKKNSDKKKRGNKRKRSPSKNKHSKNNDKNSKKNKNKRQKTSSSSSSKKKKDDPNTSNKKKDKKGAKKKNTEGEKQVERDDNTLNASKDSNNNAKEAEKVKGIPSSLSHDSLADNSTNTQAMTGNNNAVINIADTDNNNNPNDNTLVEEEPAEALIDDWWKFKSELSEVPNSKALIDSVNLTDNLLLEMSSKMMVFLSLLAISIKKGDKMLVFSQSLYTLNVIESFLQMKQWGRVCGIIKQEESLCVNHVILSQWMLHRQYLRIDGSVSNRQKIIHAFNNREEHRLMLISTKAGNMGINLQAANRVVIFDSSWNPVHDLQAIFRTYRFGQVKNVFVYRLYAAGSMEEKIYKNQVVKQSLSERVIDKKMPENHFTDSERAEFLAFMDEEDKRKILSQQSPDNNKQQSSSEDKEGEEGEGGTNKQEKEKDPDSLRQQQVLSVIASGTKDEVLYELIERIGTTIFKSIEDHDSLLADKIDEHLNEEEQKQAIDELEKEAEVHQRIANIPKHIPNIPNNLPNLPKMTSTMSALSNQKFLQQVSSAAMATVSSLPQQQLQQTAQWSTLLDNLLVPVPQPVLTIYNEPVFSTIPPPPVIPTNIPHWKPEYDTLLFILHRVFPSDVSMETSSKLLNQYIIRTNPALSGGYDANLFKQRIRDMQRDARGYYVKYLNSVYVKHRVAVLQARLPITGLTQYS